MLTKAGDRQEVSVLSKTIKNNCVFIHLYCVYTMYSEKYHPERVAVVRDQQSSEPQDNDTELTEQNTEF